MLVSRYENAINDQVNVSFLANDVSCLKIDQGKCCWTINREVISDNKTHNATVCQSRLWIKTPDHVLVFIF